MEFLDIIVTKILEVAVEFVRATAVERGLDNWILKNWEQEHSAEIPELFNMRVFLENMRSTGASGFVVHQLKFNSATSKVHFDVSIPKLFFSLGKGGVDACFFGSQIHGQASGQLSIMEPRVTGEASLNMAPDFSISLGSINLQVGVKSIKSKLKVQINDNDYSKIVNSYVHKTIPEFLEKHKADINETLAKMIQSSFTNYKPDSMIQNMF